MMPDIEHLLAKISAGNMEKGPLERAAQALAEEDCGSAGDWHDYVPAARAVLQAIREPNEAMICSGPASEPHLMGTLQLSDEITRNAKAWRAMIDAILAE